MWIGPLLPYARAGHVEWRTGLLLGLGLMVGGYFGGQWAQVLPMPVLRKAFAVVLLVVAVRMFWTSKRASSDVSDSLLLPGSLLVAPGLDRAADQGLNDQQQNEAEDMRKEPTYQGEEGAGECYAPGGR